MKLSKDQAFITHNILLIKRFSLEQLVTLIGGRRKETRAQDVLQKLEAHRYIAKSGDNYTLTSDIVMRLELLDAVRKKTGV